MTFTWSWNGGEDLYSTLPSHQVFEKLQGPRGLKGLETAATAKSLQSCPTLCDPIDGSPPGSPVPGILQTGVLKWVAIAFSDACK